MLSAETVARGCKVPECTRKPIALGLCRNHYQLHRYNTLECAKVEDKDQPSCAAEGCERVSRSSLGLCMMHYRRFERHNDLHSKFPRGPIVNRNTTEWHIGHLGYVQRRDPTNPNAGKSGSVLQHRHIMSEILGRPLAANETVHHKNGDRADNRPENLELWVSAQPAGQRVVDLVEWAKDILARYPDSDLAKLNATPEANVIPFARAVTHE